MRSQYSTYSNQELVEEIQAFTRLIDDLNAKVKDAIEELQSRLDTTNPQQLELF